MWLIVKNKILKKLPIDVLRKTKSVVEELELEDSSWELSIKK